MTIASGKHVLRLLGFSTVGCMGGVLGRFMREHYISRVQCVERGYPWRTGATACGAKGSQKTQSPIAG